MEYLKNNNVMLVIFATILTLIGLTYRIMGISDNISFWNDETHVAIYARNLLQNGSLTLPHGASTGFYQLPLYIITALTMYFFGINEFSARLPSAVVGSFLVLLSFFITKRIFNINTAIIAAFLIAFMQIQVAWSTQTRGYIWLQLLVVIVIGLSHKASQTLERKKLLFIFAVSISLIAGLFHASGFLILIIPIITLFHDFYLLWKNSSASSKVILLIGFITLTISVFFILKGSIINTTFLEKYLTSWNNNTTHYRIFFTHNYLYLVTGSIIGFLLFFKRNKKLNIAVLTYTILLLSLCLFKFGRYIRYSLPLFPIMFMYFGYIVSIGIEKVNKKRSLLLGIIFLMILFLFDSKIQRTPQTYYTINSDMRENPLADYKKVYKNIEGMLNKNERLAVIDAWNDRGYWYLDGYKHLFIFNSYGNKGDKDYILGTINLTHFDDILSLEKTYPQGVILLEEWESLMNDATKSKVKERYKLLFRVPYLEQNLKDPWGITVYSWGFDATSSASVQ